MKTEKPLQTDHFEANPTIQILDLGDESSPFSDKSTLRSSLKINYQLLAQEILREMRGALSQRQLSEQLGFSFNQVGKWESGFTQVKWDDFLNVCRVLNVPIEKHFKNTFWTVGDELAPIDYIRSLAHHLSQNSFNAKLVRDLNKKWLAGTSMPDLAEVLEMIGTQTAMLLGFVSKFLDCTKFESIKSEYETFLKTIDAVFSNPVVVYINAALNLRAYQELPEHDENLLAEHSACSVEELRQALKLMIGHGLVTYANKKFTPSPFDYSFGVLRHPKLRGLAKRTTLLAAERFPETPINVDKTKVANGAAYSVRVAALSSDAALQIMDLISDFHSRVGEVIRQDQGPKDNVQVLLYHSFPSNINLPSTNLPLGPEKQN